MAVLNITTNKTRAQMVTELTNWADATKVSGNDYCWACADNITVTAEIELYGFELIFASGFGIKSQAGGNIKVSKDIFNTFYLTTTLTFLGSGSHLGAISLVSGTGKWTGGGLSIRTQGRGLEFSSTTSQCDLKDLTVDALKNNVFYLKINIHTDGEINVFRLSGVTVQYVRGKFTMNPKGYGIINGDHFAIAKLSGSGTFKGFTMLSDSTTTIALYSSGTMTFSDGRIDPDRVTSSPKNNNNVRRIIQRTITLNPSDENGANISAFNYRISSNRNVMPGNVTTPNTQIITENNKNFGYQYLMNVWNAFRAAGSASYSPMVNITSDKDFKVQFRKYGNLESIVHYNSYYYAQIAQSAMQNDTFIHSATPILASTTTAAQFYDGVRSLVAGNFALPYDLLTTDGETLTIKTGWSLGYNTVNTNLSILTSNNKILIGKDSYIGKMNTGRFKYSKLSGSVSSFMSTHTDLTFARDDGKANLNLQITCPPGSKDPVAGVWLFSQGLDNRAGMITGQTTGTGVTNISLQVSASAKYYCTAKALGSNQYTPFVIEPVGGLGGSRDITLFVYEKNDGTPLLPTTLTPAQTAIADTFEFHTTHIDIKIPTGFSTNSRWSSTDKIWQYKAEDFIPIAYKLDVIQTALILLGRNQLMFLQEGRILISAATNAKILEQDPANKTTVGSTTNIKVSLTTISMGRIGDTDARNTFIDNSNGAIDVRGGVPINGGFSIADANRLVIVETKANETHQRLALDSAKPLTNKPDGGITSTGITIVATELADGSIKQTRS